MVGEEFLEWNSSVITTFQDVGDSSKIIKRAVFEGVLVEKSTSSSVKSQNRACSKSTFFGVAIQLAVRGLAQACAV